jgi:hypothetical protein
MEQVIQHEVAATDKALYNTVLMRETFDGVRDIVIDVSGDQESAFRDTETNMIAARNFGVTAIGTLAVSTAMYKVGLTIPSAVAGGAGALKAGVYLRDFARSGWDLAMNVYSNAWNTATEPANPSSLDS